MLTVSDYFRRFRDSKEITDDFRKNAEKLISKVSLMLSMIPYKTTITSGFRPQAYNKQIGGSINSHHCFARAVDLWDPDKIIGNWCLSNETWLKQEGLFLEHPDVTLKSDDPKKRWIHVQIVAPRSGNTFFYP